jgi:hypothetical protein
MLEGELKRAGYKIIKVISNAQKTVETLALKLDDNVDKIYITQS